MESDQNQQTDPEELKKREAEAKRDAVRPVVRMVIDRLVLLGRAKPITQEELDTLIDETIPRFDAFAQSVSTAIAFELAQQAHSLAQLATVLTGGMPGFRVVQLVPEEATPPGMQNTPRGPRGVVT